MNNSEILHGLQLSFIGADTNYPTADGKRGPRTYLDSAAASLMMKPAYDIAHHFLNHYASTHSDMHYSARGATEAFTWAHNRVLEFVGASEDKY